MTMTVERAKRLIHRIVDRRLERVVPAGVTEPIRGTITEVYPASRTVMARLRGSTTSVPVEGVPMLPSPLGSLSVPVDAMFDRGPGGYLMLSHLLGVDPAAPQLLGSQHLLDVRDWGALCDGETDDTAAVQLALQESAGLGPLVIPGICLITAPLVINRSGTRVWGLRGKGASHYASGSTGNGIGSGLRWGGAEYTSGDMDAFTMLRVEPITGTGMPHLSDVELLGLGFEGASRAARCVSWRSVVGGRVDIYVEHAKGRALETGCVEQLGEFRDTQECDIAVHFDQTGAADGVGVWLGSEPLDTGANTSHNILYLSGRYNLSDAVVFANTDNNLAVFIRTLVIGAGPYGYGIRFKGANNEGGGGHARYNSILHGGPSKGGCLSEGTGLPSPAVQNWIGRYDRQSGGNPVPVVESGSTLFWAGNTDEPHATDRHALYQVGVISPSQLTGNTDDWSPSGLSTANVIRASTDASRNLTGISGGSSGRRLRLVNVGAQNLVLVHDATSTAANRFLCPGSANHTLNANDAAELWYDGTSSRWRVIAA